MSLLQVFPEMANQRSGFGQNSCAADKQECVFGSFEFNTLVLKIFMINGLDCKLCNLQAYNFAKPSAKSKSFCTNVNMTVLSSLQFSAFHH